MTRTDAENCDQIWTEHCQNLESLQKYASAMHCLATEHWSKNPQTRIDWCHAVLQEYFFEDGLKKCLEKDRRRQTRQSELNKEDKQSPDPNSVRDLNDENSSTNSVIVSGVVNSSGKGVGQDNTHELEVSIPVEGKIPLLDVGSCFNPFGEFDEYLSVGIDICPANKDVYLCDILGVETTEHDFSKTDISRVLSNLKSPVESLPKQGFYVIVFSLLLEYLPSPVQRWNCCKKAHSLLAKNGLLLIVTPDSHKQHRNAAMIRDWKKAIEALGFLRWKYVKLEHIHCMAFRRVFETSTGDCGDMSTNMYIHQDFLEEEEDDTRQSLYTEEDETMFKQCLAELPVSIIDEDSDS